MNRAGRRGRVLRSLSMIPGAALAILPSAHCPFCLGAYGALVSSLGLGFLINEAVLGPMIAAFLVLGIVAVAWMMRSHKRWGPLVWTTIGSAAVAAGRLVWDVPWLLYGGGAIVLGASIWNLWLKRPQPQPLTQIRIGRKGETS